MFIILLFAFRDRLLQWDLLEYALFEVLVDCAHCHCKWVLNWCNLQISLVESPSLFHQETRVFNLINALFRRSTMLRLEPDITGADHIVLLEREILLDNLVVTVIWINGLSGLVTHVVSHWKITFSLVFLCVFYHIEIVLLLMNFDRLQIRTDANASALVNRLLEFKCFSVEGFELAQSWLEIVVYKANQFRLTVAHSH